MKPKYFRKIIDISDTINIWFRDLFNIDPKRKIMEAKQDLVSVNELDRKIGKSLDL